MGEISLIEYICANNPDGVNSVLELFGYTPSSDYNIQVNLSERLVTEQGELGLDALMTQHPDYDVIIEDYKKSDEFIELTKPKKEEIKETIQATKQEDNSSNQLINNEYLSRSNFNNTLRDIVLVVMAFWLIKEIVKRD